MRRTAQLPDGRWVSIVPSELRLEIADAWADYGEVLPLAETVGQLHRALILVAADPVAPLQVDDAALIRAAVGGLSWHRVSYGPNSGSQCWNIGIALLPQARGHGIGSVAQRLLAEHLFATTTTNRVEAGTDIANVAEQHALVRAGYRREGVLRGAQFRADGVHHDLVLYAVTRADLST